MKLGRYIGAAVLVMALGAGGFFAFNHAAPAQAQDLTPEQRAALQAQYDELQKEIAQLQQVVSETQAKKNSLTGDVSALTAQINAAEAKIKQRNVVISQLQDQITQKAAVVETLQQKLQDSEDSLGKLLRERQQQEATPLAVVALSSGSLSDFFSTLNDIDSLDSALQDHMQELQGIKTQTEAQKAALAAQQNAQVDARYAVQQQEQQVSASKAQKSQLLAITTDQEKQYQKVLADNQAKAAAIRAALFPLRDAASIQFGDALQYAQAAEKKTGVDPALVLAILTQESNLGQNVGQCYLTNDSTGAGVGKNSGTAFKNVMHPTRDVPPFLALSAKLGFDPHHQVVSCPIASAGGYGGAMGPAQFIASTWSLYATRIASVDGKSVANPWDPQDAIAAMSLYLSDLGAGAGGYTAEHTAAAKYYAGSAWRTAGNTYANQVMSKVANIQKNIDFLNNI